MQRPATPVAAPAEKNIDDEIVEVTPSPIQPKRRRGRPRKNSATKMVTKKTSEEAKKAPRRRRDPVRELVHVTENDAAVRQEDEVGYIFAIHQLS